jgi:hypothetical protein
MNCFSQNLVLKCSSKVPLSTESIVLIKLKNLIPYFSLRLTMQEIAIKINSFEQMLLPEKTKFVCKNCGYSRDIANFRLNQLLGQPSKITKNCDSEYFGCGSKNSLKDEDINFQDWTIARGSKSYETYIMYLQGHSDDLNLQLGKNVTFNVLSIAEKPNTKNTMICYAEFKLEVIYITEDTCCPVHPEERNICYFEHGPVKGNWAYYGYLKAVNLLYDKNTELTEAPKPPLS